MITELNDKYKSPVTDKDNKTYSTPLAYLDEEIGRLDTKVTEAAEAEAKAQVRAVRYSPVTRLSI